MPRVKREKLITVFKHGIINTVSSEMIRGGAASNSRNFITKLDRLELTRGRRLIGAEESGNNPVLGLHVSKQQDGTEVIFRKIGTKLQYSHGSTWTDIKTDLTADEEMCFVDVVTPAGHMVFMSSIDGLYKIYTANPGSLIDLSSATKNANVRSKILFNKSRLAAWGYEKDPTGLLFSRVDRDSNYINVSGESVGALGATEYSHTTANTQIFGVLISDGTQTITDDKNGNLQGDGSGTVNYATGEIDVTFNEATTGDVTIDYLYEDPTNGGLADFSYSATRLAGEGNIQRQDSLGAETRLTLVFDNKYISLQDRGSWNVEFDSTDEDWDNQPFRREIGVPNWKAGVTTANGIIYVDIFDPENPKLKIVTYDKYNEFLVPYTLSEDAKGVGFKMSDYEFDQAVMKKFGDLIVISCRTSNSSNNNKKIIYNTSQNSFDVMDNGYDFFAIFANKLIAGDSSSPNVYEIFSGWDDLDNNIEGEWESGNSGLGTSQLKKVKRFQVEGYKAVTQSFKIYSSYDGDIDELIGEVTRDDIEQGNSILVGSCLVGDEAIGGGDEVEGYHFFKEFKIHTPKFLRRKIKIVPTGLGYLDIRGFKDSDIRLKGHKLPKKNRNLGGASPASGFDADAFDQSSFS